MNSGCHMLLASGKKNNNIKNMIGNKIYTHFTPIISSLDAKKKWIIGSLNSSGIIYIDQGASRALNNRKSLLAAGIIKIKGSFNKGENVLIVDQNDKHLARGLASFNSKEIDKIKKLESPPKIINKLFSNSEINKFLELYRKLHLTVHNKKQNVIKKKWLKSFNNKLKELY